MSSSIIDELLTPHFAFLRVRCDLLLAGPEIISVNMTGVMLVYSSLFARWAWVVKPRNIALSACHVVNVVSGQAVIP
jgi:hypothetical protein